MAWLAAVWITCLGCGPPHYVERTYLVERSILVPVPAPDLTSGPPAGHVELASGNATVLYTRTPRLSPDSEAGLYVPRHQPGATIRVPAWTFVHGRLTFEYLPSRGARAVPAGTAAAPSADGGVLGIGVGASVYLTRAVWLEGSFDLLVAAIRSDMVISCIDGCTWGGGGTNRSELFLEAIVRGQLRAGLALGPLELSAGVLLRNHPLNTGRSTYTVIMEEYDRTPPEFPHLVRRGPLMGAAGFAVALRPFEQLAIVARLYQPFDFGSSAVAYGPILGLSVVAAIPAKRGPGAWTRARRPSWAPDPEPEDDLDDLLDDLDWLESAEESAPAEPAPSSGGAATSAHRVEGDTWNNDWWARERARCSPLRAERRRLRSRSRPGPGADVSAHRPRSAHCGPLDGPREVRRGHGNASRPRGELSPSTRGHRN